MYLGCYDGKENERDREFFKKIEKVNNIILDGFRTDCIDDDLTWSELFDNLAEPEKNLYIYDKSFNHVYREFVNSVNMINNILLEKIKDGTIKKYFEQEFDWHQLYYITIGIENNIDISIYAKKEFTGNQMGLIVRGLLKGNNIIHYFEEGFNDAQVNVLLMSLEDNKDITSYADKKYNSDQMMEMYFAQQLGINLADYVDETCSADVMSYVTNCLVKDIDISKYIKDGYSDIHLKYISYLVSDNKDFKPLLDKNLSNDEIFKRYKDLLLTDN